MIIRGALPLRSRWSAAVCVLYITSPANTPKFLTVSLLYLVRHGETDYNKFRRWQGRVDISLNDRGIQQAQQVKMWFQEQGIEVPRTYASPLRRAVETAHIVQTDRSQIVVDKRLIEIDMGEYDGRYEDELVKEVGVERYERWRGENFAVAAPGGESIFDVMQRLKGFAGEFVTGALKDLCIVAHQGVLVAIKSLLTECSNPQALGEFRQKNSEIDIWNMLEKQRVGTVDVG